MKTITNEKDFDRIFDESSESILDYADMSTAHRPNLTNEQRPMSLNLPAWLIATMDAEAARRGTTRASVAKNWLVDRADQERERRARLAG